MKTKITKEHYLENENVVLFGSHGCGKTRYFNKPVAYGLENSTFIVVTANSDCFDKDISVNLSANLPEIDFSKNLVTTFGYNVTEIENKNLEIIIENLLNFDNKKDILFIIDEAGSFNLDFLTKEMIEKFNKKGIYFAFIFQVLAQVKNKDILDACSTMLNFGGIDEGTINLFENNTKKLYIPYMQPTECIYKKGSETVKDTKQSFTSSTIFKYYRQKANLSQIELANLSEQTVRNIRAIEKNPEKIQKMSAINLYKISKVLGCSMETLLEI